MRQIGIDRKYGRVYVERLEGNEALHGTMPVFVLLAKDNATLPAVETYGMACGAMGSPDAHLQGVSETKTDIEAWRDAYADACKVPD